MVRLSRLYFPLTVLFLFVQGCSSEPEWIELQHPLGWIQVDARSMKEKSGVVSLSCRVVCTSPWEMEGCPYQVQTIVLDAAITCAKQELTINASQVVDINGNEAVSPLKQEYVDLVAGEIQALLLSFACRQ